MLSAPGGSGARDEPVRAQLVAVLSPVAARPAALPLRTPDVEPPPVATSSAVPATAPLADPPRLQKPPAPTPGGQLTINVAEAADPPDAAYTALLRQFHPGAVAAPIEFEVAPVGAYPKAALKSQRNAQIRVLVILHEDGRVELAKGSVHDAMFLPAIRAALATARVPPAAQQGRAPLAWGVLLFEFEFVGSVAN